MTFNNSKIVLIDGFAASSYNVNKHSSHNFICDIFEIHTFNAAHVNFVSNIPLSYDDSGNTKIVNTFLRNYKANFIFQMTTYYANQNSVVRSLSSKNTNISGIINFLETEKYNSERQKITFASCGKTKGNTDTMNKNFSVNTSNLSRFTPKYGGTLYAEYYSEVYNIPVFCVRISNNYGQQVMFGNYTNLMPTIVNNVLLAQDIIISATGNATRDLITSINTVNILLKLITITFNKPEIFNGGTRIKGVISTTVANVIFLSDSQIKIIYHTPKNSLHVKNRYLNVDLSIILQIHNLILKLVDGLITTIKCIK